MFGCIFRNIQRLLVQIHQGLQKSRADVLQMLSLQMEALKYNDHILQQLFSKPVLTSSWPRLQPENVASKV